ncbi:SOL3 [[Candida] subhashii]|uniref:6-phosphogluconolactonase-like protein n=1 Tax=[Candida] subhashii TaxID=561895 RepID=A0A8J5QLF2_9ASCO|nr:SOL3 [[Candida] subhashii]KAG7662618.1 SOL3 [[Candida] subhashii]
MPAKVYAYPESIDVANAVGKYIIEHQNQAIAANGSFKIALSGGSLGKVLKKALIDNKEVASSVKWEQWDVYFSDERLVPLNHADSNFGLFNELVLNHLPSEVGKPRLNVIDESLLTGKDGQLDENVDISKDIQIAKDYASKLPTDGKFDVILLGCGPDGHTCSLFAGHKLLQERSELIAYINDSPKLPPRRITFTFPVLENATSIAFVAEGAGKAITLKEIFNDKKSQLPSKLVNEIDTGVQVNWFVDNAAVEGVDYLTAKY